MSREPRAYRLRPVRPEEVKPGLVVYGLVTARDHYPAFLVQRRVSAASTTGRTMQTQDWSREDCAWGPPPPTSPYPRDDCRSWTRSKGWLVLEEEAGWAP